MARIIDLRIDQGSDCSITLPAIKDFNGTVVNLTGGSVSGAFAPDVMSQGTPLPLSITDAQHGIITINFTSGQTAAMTPGRYLYSVIYQSVTPIKRTCVFEGTVLVVPVIGSGGNQDTTPPPSGLVWNTDTQTWEQAQGAWSDQ